MRSTVGRSTMAALLVFFAPAVFAAPPVTVSPGDVSEVAATDARCPTFSWGQVDGAESYEMVVYRLGEKEDDGLPVVRRSFPGSVNVWTPSLDQCLERGGRYAWSIRAASDNEATEWSAPSLFEVASGFSEAEIRELLMRVADPVSVPGTSGRAARGVSPAPPEITLEGQSAQGPMTLGPASGAQSLVAYGDSCCDGANPDSYATELGNQSVENDPDVLALVVSEKHGSGPNVNFIGFFDREELTGALRLIGEIESTAGGSVHFTGSASISGWEPVSSPTQQCGAGASNCPGTVDCTLGRKVLGGGFNSVSNNGLYLWSSYPLDDDTWYVGLGNSSGANVTFTVEAICAEVGP